MKRQTLVVGKAEGAYDGAQRYYLRILEHDPLDERANLDLVSALGEGGRVGEARRRYRAYADRMAENGLEAAPFPTPSGQPL